LRTDIAGFAGIAARGPVGIAVAIESFRQFQAVFGNFIGGGEGATENVILVDGKGFPGSAVMQTREAFTVGASGAHGNRLEIVDGGHVFTYSLTLGNGASSNRVDITGAGSQLDGNHSSSVFSLGIGNATNNILYVADGGQLSGYGNYQAAVGGRGDGTTTGLTVGNRLIVGTDGYANINNELNIGRITGAGSVAKDNQVLVSGIGALFNLRIDRFIYIGSAFNEAVAHDNEFIVEDGALVTSGGICLGNIDATGVSRDNRLIVRNNGAVYLNPGTPYSYGLHLGGRDGGTHPFDNYVEVTSGGLLSSRYIYIRSESNNVLRIRDGGVYDLPHDNLQVVSLTPGDVSIDNGVISYSCNNVDVTTHHWTSQLNKFAWSGNNGLRLNNSYNNGGIDQSYLFEHNVTSTNWAFLQMVNGTTRYQGANNGLPLQIGAAVGSSASMLCSNTTAFVSLPFICNGTLTICNSTLTFENTAEINGELVISLEKMAEGTLINALNGLDFNGSLRFTGTLPRGCGPFTLFEGDRTGTFKVAGIPPDYAVKYDLVSPGSVSLIWAPRSIFMIR